MDVTYHTDYYAGGEPTRYLAREEARDDRVLEDRDVSEYVANPVGETFVQGGAAVATDYGKHVLYADLLVADGHLNTFSSRAYSYFEEYVVFECDLCEGGSGSALWGVTIHGSIESTDDQGEASFGYQLRFDYSDYLVNLNFDTRRDASGNYAGTEYFIVDFEFGREYILESTAYAEVHLGNYAQDYSVSGYADFSRTIALTVVNLPEGVTMVTGSGTQYPIDYTIPAVPRPSPLALLGVPLALVVRRRGHARSACSTVQSVSADAPDEQRGVSVRRWCHQRACLSSGERTPDGFVCIRRKQRKKPSDGRLETGTPISRGFRIVAAHATERGASSPPKQ